MVFVRCVRASRDNRPRRRAREGCASHAAALWILVFTSGAAAAPLALERNVRADVSVPDPRSGLVAVSLSIPVETLARDYVDLGFLTARQRPGALRTITARADSMPVPVLEPDPDRPYIRRVKLPPATATLTLDYTLDPIFYAPGDSGDNPADARSRVTTYLGILRTSAIFPRFDAGPLGARVNLRLPPGWTAVTPWTAENGSFAVTAREFAATDYIAVGRFRVSQVTIGALTVRIGVPSDAKVSLDRVERLVRQELTLVGAPPPGGRIRSLVVIPTDFMRGGTAGANSIVQPALPDVLAHEIFHWWNDTALTADEATWFREGFSEYYGIRMARDSKAWGPMNSVRCLADKAAETGVLEQKRPVSLEEASRQFAHTTRARRLIYSKGALFAHVLDRYLAQYGRSLDDAVRAIVTSRAKQLTNDAIMTVFHDVYDGLADAYLRAIVKNPGRLPDDLGLPPATGESGCARFLPPPLGPRRGRASSISRPTSILTVRGSDPPHAAPRTLIPTYAR